MTVLDPKAQDYLNKGGTLSNYSIPTLSTTFPKTPEGTVNTPIVTSKKADDHILSLGDVISKANVDIANATQGLKQAQQTKADADATKKQQDIENQQNQSPEDKTTAILNALTGTQNTEVTPDPTQQNVIDTNTEQNKLDEQNQAIVGNAIDSMNAGTYPLTPIEKASVDNIATGYKTAYASAQELVSNQLAGQTVQNAKYGLQMYSPTEALSRIANITKEGSAKIGELNTKLLDAQSKLTQAFQDSDYKTATALYNKIGDTIKARTTEINDINKAVADATKEMKQNAKDNATMQLNALIHDDTVSYQEKQQAIAKAQLDETTRHNKAVELETRLKDGMTAGNSPTGSGVTGDTNDWLSEFYGSGGQVALPALGIGNAAASMKLSILNGIAKRALSLGINGAEFASIMSDKSAAQKALTTLSKNEAVMSVAEGTATRNFDQILAQMPTLPPKTFNPLLNQFIQTGAIQTGNPNIKPFANLLTTTLNEYAKVITGQTTGAGVSDAARREAQAMISASDNPDTLRNFIATAKKEMDNRVSSFKEAKDGIFRVIQNPQGEVGNIQANQSSDARTALINFGMQSSQNKAMLDEIHKAYPQMTDTEAAESLGIMP